MQLKDLKGKFHCVATLGSDNCLENADAIAANIITQVEAQGGKAERVGDKVQVVGGAQFWMLPKMPKRREGTLTIRSKDFVFSYDGKESFGTKPKAADMTENGFKLAMYNGDIINYVLTPITE